MNIVGIIKPADAIHSLTPNADWILYGDSLEWLDEVQTEPTALEIANEVIRLQAAEPLRLLRMERNVKLAESDWTQMVDSSLTDSVKAEWVTYRTALKDITDSATSLDDVTWPEKP